MMRLILCLFSGDVLLKPIVANAGMDISHWFNPKTKDVSYIPSFSKFLAMVNSADLHHTDQGLHFLLFQVCHFEISTYV